MQNNPELELPIEGLNEYRKKKKKKSIESYNWEFSLNDFIDFIEKSREYQEKCFLRKPKPVFFFKKTLFKPKTIYNEKIYWRKELEKNLKRYWFKNILKNVYEPELFLLTIRAKRMMRVSLYKLEEYYIIKSLVPKRKFLSYPRLFCFFNWTYVNKKLIFYLYK